MKRPRPSLAIVSSLALFAGCAVVLDASSDLGPHCRFDGDDDTTCGSCISSNCQPLVDACCADEACADDLDSLDDCADGDFLGCTDLFLYAGALGECVLDACISACDPYSSGALEGGSGSGGSGSAGLIAVCESGELSCVCTAELEAGQVTTTCDEFSIDSGSCCREVGYPDVGLACGCFTAECVDYGSFCECGYFDAVDDGFSSCSSLYEVCCLDPVELRCLCSDDSQCLESEIFVESCDAAELGCSAGQEPTSDCDL